MEELKKQVDEIIAKHGEEAVVKAVQVLTNKALKSIPADHMDILGVDKLHATINQLDSATAEILTAGQANELAYGNKSDLIKQSRQLETEIKLAESEAIMQIEGSGKDAYVVIAGRKTALTNDQSRDAYRRMASKTQREELAQVEGAMAKIDVEIAKAKEKYFATQESSQNIRAKAHVQAALLNFLR